MQLFLFLFLCFSSIPYFVNGRQCWRFSEYEYDGSIQKSDRVQITCPSDYCQTVSEQGTDFNVFNGTCPDKTVPILNCETNGVGCQNEKVGSTYIKVCCCNSDLCNSSFDHSSMICVLFMTTLYYLFL